MGTPRVFGRASAFAPARGAPRPGYASDCMYIRPGNTGELHGVKVMVFLRGWLMTFSEGGDERVPPDSYR